MALVGPVSAQRWSLAGRLVRRQARAPSKVGQALSIPQSPFSIPLGRFIDPGPARHGIHR